MHRHIVLFNFKGSVAAADRERVTERLRTLGKLPTVASFLVAKNILEKNDKRPFEWVMMGDYADEKARDAYEKDPHHIQVIRQEWLPVVETYAVFDTNF